MIYSWILHKCFTQPNKKATRAIDKIYRCTTSPEPLVQILSYFAEMFFKMSSTTVLQMALLRRTKGLLQLLVSNSIILINKLLLSHLFKIQNDFEEMFL